MLKSVAGVQRMRAMDLNLEAIMVLCTEEVNRDISVRIAFATEQKRHAVL